MESQDDQFLTVSEVARRLKVSRPTVYKLIRKGRLRVVQFDRVLRIPANELAELATFGRTEDAAPAEGGVGDDV